jgi:nicotinate-nucleotide pyrophosphorylase (carboxylating)
MQEPADDEDGDDEGGGAHDGASSKGSAGRFALDARATHALRFVEVECDSVEQFRAIAALPAGTVDYALLDNMDPARLAECVRIRDAQAPRMLLEASGGVRLETVRAIAEAGVDRISIGGLTHSAPALDVGLDVEAP